MTDVAIRVKDLSKCYPIYGAPRDRLTQFIAPRLQRMVGLAPKNYYREFWALRDVSFEVQKGEPIGIIGRNGAGKSTLLQLICGTVSPTGGSIETSGRIAALLELGSGFNPEFTGRENVYLNASVLGLSKEEIDARFDDIAAFADIGDFLEQPVKTYSSGMLMRLAFAVSTCVDPEILIVDEVLGVGDAPFQSKCFKRLRDLIEKGVNLLFVSHDISTVRAVCKRALWLSQGRIVLWGEAMKVAREYERFCWREQGVIFPEQAEHESRSVPAIVQSLAAKADPSIPPILFEPNLRFEADRRRSRTGTGAVIVKNFLMLNSEGLPASSCEYDETLLLYYLLEVCEPVSSDVMIGFRVRDTKGVHVCSANDINTMHRLNAKAGEHYVVSTELRFPLTHQDYVVRTGVFGFQDGRALYNGVYDFSRAVIWDVIEDAAYIKVHPCKIMPMAGPVIATFDLKVMRLH